MKHSWSNSVFPIAAIFSFRMFGLFMLIPVFSVYAAHLNHATPTLVGIALGSYGLSQGLLQIPFGMLSDRIGRKPILTLGLILFAAGSLLGALTESIYGMIFARILQGTGAIGSVLIALLADLTPEKDRTKAMAMIGATIGLSFSLAVIISPVITRHFGLPGIFFLTVFLAFLGIFLLYRVIPTPDHESFHAESEADPALFKTVFKDPQLLRLDLAIFCQHFILTATFFAVPLLLQHQIHLGHLTRPWQFYLPILLVSFVMILPLIIWAEKKHQVKVLLIGAILLTTLSQLALIFTHQQWWALCFFIFFYFVAFNSLEASLPSLVSKQSNAKTKGTAMGVYSSSQFLGIFAGGSLAGFLFHVGSYSTIFTVNLMVSLVWLFSALSTQIKALQSV